ncbi:acetoacetate decarboxylase family protein [Rubrivirga sp. IMCC45206]|uniref:acetoacetate decarboxylase family protein n=1 Tax=Rubrivirga sp. IMCC45206 TaxID=3391614 RepID=UPI00398FFFD8
MPSPARQRRLAGRHALVDGIRFVMPVHSEHSPALMAAFPCDAEKAAALLPGGEVHPFRMPDGRALLVVTVIDYRTTDIGAYIEYSIAIACTHGPAPAPRLLPALFRERYGLGQYVLDLPVSTDVSVKGGKGIWGMPKHKAPLDFVVGDDVVSSQYDLDGQLVLRVDVRKPGRAWLKIKLAAANYCAFRGMLMKSYISFAARAGFRLFDKTAATLTFGDHPRIAPVKALDVDPHPVFAAYLPDSGGVLDDHFEGWFLTHNTPPEPGDGGDGLDSVVPLGLSEEWPPPPTRDAVPTAAHAA